MAELNPNHGVVNEVQEHWYKIAAILVGRIPGGKVTITMADIERVAGKAIVIKPFNDVIDLEIVSMEEAERLAKKEGGLPC